MKQCPFCGMELENSARFCCRCGRSLENTAQAAAAVQTMPPQAADASEPAPHEYMPPAFEQHPFEPHPYEPADYSSIHVYGENEEPAPQYYAPSYDGNTDRPRQETSRVWSVLRAILGGFGTAFVLMLCLGSKWSGENVSAIILLAAAAWLLPAAPLDRLRRRIVPKAWLRGLIIAALIIAAFVWSGASSSDSDRESNAAVPQSAVTENMKQEEEPVSENSFDEIALLKEADRKN